MAPQWTRQEVEQRGSKREGGGGDVLIIIDNVVYDVTPFLPEHPGGAEALLDCAGKDATRCFRDVGHSDHALELRESFAVGEIVAQERWPVEPREARAAPRTSDPITLRGLVTVAGPPLAFAAAAYLLFLYLF